MEFASLLDYKFVISNYVFQIAQLICRFEFGCLLAK